MRVILFLLCIAAACGTLFAFCGMVAEMSPDVYFKDAVFIGGMPEYESSPQFGYEVQANLREMGRLSLQYGSEEKILAESEENAKDADAAEETLEHFRISKALLDQSEGFHYYISGKAGTMTNMKEKSAEAAFESCRQNPVYLICGKDFSECSIPNDYSWWDSDTASRLDAAGTVYCISYDQAYLDRMQTAYEQSYAGAAKWFPVALGSAIASVFLLIVLMVLTGPKREDGTRQLYAVDRVWTEAQLGAFALAVLGIVVVGGEVLWYVYTIVGRQGENGTLQYFPQCLSGLRGSVFLLMVLAFALLAGVALWLTLAFIRLIKAKRFFRNSLCGKIFTAAAGSLSAVFLGGSMMRKVVLIALAVCLASATIFLAPLVFIVILIFAPRWVSRFEEIRCGVDEVRNGNLNYKIPIEPSARMTELGQLAEGINEISAASSLAVQNELKNQRMKTELISNVSHDLKTPLTSIITYIDLLKREGLTSPDAPEYLSILDQKAQRLRKLTEDLFEAAKASSGAMPVYTETVDLMSLMKQSMGEMNDRIEASGLNFILNAEKEHYFVYADGQLLSRVVDNLLGNVLKYAQDGSRVYVDLTEKPGKSEENGMYGNAVLEIKNISKQQLNISAEELMERFTRGDEARSTEGSGLGLAIAKDLVRLMGGWFEISIDGDLFKARVMLPCAPPPRESGAEAEKKAESRPIEGE